MFAHIASTDMMDTANHWLIVLLKKFPFVDCVDLVYHEPRLGYLPTYDVLCTLYYGENYESSRDAVMSAMQLCLRTRPYLAINCVVREAGAEGDWKETIWRLGGSMQDD